MLKNSGGIYPFFDDPWYDTDSAHTVPYGDVHDGHRVARGQGRRAHRVLERPHDRGAPRARSSCSTTSRRRSGRPTCSTASSSTRRRPTSSSRARRRSSTRRSTCAATRPTRRRTSSAAAAWIHHAWNGDVVNARNQSKEPENLRFQTCEEGIPVGSDCMAIPANARHPGTATLFIDWMLDPENASENVVLVRLPDAGQGHRGRVRRARRQRPGDRRSPTEDLANGQQFRELDAARQEGLGPRVDGGEGVTDAFWRRFLFPGALWLLLLLRRPVRHRGADLARREQRVRRRHLRLEPGELRRRARPAVRAGAAALGRLRGRHRRALPADRLPSGLLHRPLRRPPHATC